MNTFAEAMRDAGIDPPCSLVADGEIRRFDIPGDRKLSKNGWYVLYDDPPAGAFGCWKRGIQETWSGKAFSEEERADFRAKIERAKRMRREKERKARAECREKAERIWSRAAHGSHPYLDRKGVKPYGVRVYKGSLLVPLRDTAGVLHGLQFISSTSEKKFLSGTAKKGCYHAVGKPDAFLCVCEGYATGASIHEATGAAVAVAFDAGNLQPVAESLHAKLPKLKIVVCADNDVWTDGNPGITKAREAAAIVGGAVAVPEFSDLSARPTDFNDMHRLCGLDEVVRHIYLAK